MATARRTWGVTLDARTPPYLSDHRVQGAVVYLAAAFVEMGLSAARAGLGEGPIVLEEVEILKALVLNDRAASEMQLTLDDDATSFDIRSRSCAADSSWALNVSGRMRLNSYSPEPNPIDLQALLDRCPTEFSVFKFYELFEGSGLEYGPEFRTIESIRLGEEEGVFEIRGAEPGSDAEDCLLPPPVLDACFQAPTLAIRGEGLYLPVFLGKLT